MRSLFTQIKQYFATFYQSFDKSGLLSRPRKVDFLESLKNPKFVRGAYIVLDWT